MDRREDGGIAPITGLAETAAGASERRRGGSERAGSAAARSLGNVRRSFAPWADPSASPYVEFRGITKRFGDFTAVDDLSLSIYEREFHALLGPSGCGKSTLLRMLAGFEEATGGDILLEGRSLRGVPPHRRPVNMMFQSYALFPHMSVEGNVAYGLKREGMAKGEIADRVADVLRLVKMGDFAHRKPHQLSGGQRQRVALARSLAKRPKLLLLDEPLGALDKKLREETQFELSDLQEELGLTFVVVTHDQEEAMTMADRISVMDHGRIVQVGTPGEIYEAPATRYVADFVGSINLIEGTVVSVDGSMVTLEADGRTHRVESEGELPDSGSKAWLAIRPEKLRVSRDEPVDPTANALRGEVWDLAYLGDMTLYNVRLPSGAIVRASVLNATRAADDPISWEDEVWLTHANDAGTVLVR